MGTRREHLSIFLTTQHHLNTFPIPGVFPILWVMLPPEGSPQLIFPHFSLQKDSTCHVHLCKTSDWRRIARWSWHFTDSILGKVGCEGIQLSRILMVGILASGYQLQWYKLRYLPSCSRNEVLPGAEVPCALGIVIDFVASDSDALFLLGILQYCLFLFCLH